MKNVKTRYPNFYKILIEERNDVMAHNLIRLMKKDPDKKILAIVGAGHEDELIRIIKEEERKEVQQEDRGR